jgi:hypothetical protein
MIDLQNIKLKHQKSKLAENTLPSWLSVILTTVNRAF